MSRKLLSIVASLGALGLLVWLWSGSAKPRPVRVDGDEVPNFRESRVEGARPLPPLEEIRFADGEPSVSFFAIGDTGFGGEILRANAAGMERAAEERPVGFALLLGDNFYLEGVQTTEDPRWKEIFEDGFPGKALAVPFYAVLGNHDHRGSLDAQIAYTKQSARWKMPARWYTFSMPLKDGASAQFFALDTQPWKSGWAEASEEASWLEGELSRSRARWKIVFGHHPLLSHGSHGPTEAVAERLGPLLERSGVDLVVSGHDHDLQLLRSKSGWLQLVSGAGSSTRDTSWGDDTLFAAASPGFAWVGLGPDEMWIEIATAAGGPRFRWKVEKR